MLIAKDTFNVLHHHALIVEKDVQVLEEVLKLYSTLPKTRSAADSQ